MKLIFSIRSENGEILRKQEYHSKEVLTWTGSKRDEVITYLQSLPHYTRGKLKGPMAYRALPQKELNYYDDQGHELVLSQEAYDGIKTGLHYTEPHYEDGSSYSCYPISKDAPWIVLKDQDEFYNTVSLFKLVEKKLCGDIRKPHNLGCLRESVRLYEWLTTLGCSTQIKLRKEYYGYENERVRLYVSTSKCQEESIGELSHDQKKLFRTFKNSTVVKMIHSPMKQEKIYNDQKAELTGIRED